MIDQPTKQTPDQFAQINRTALFVLLWLLGHGATLNRVAGQQPSEARLLDGPALIRELAEFKGVKPRFPNREFDTDVEAHVTYWDPEWRQLYVQEQGHATWVRLPPHVLASSSEIELGTRLRIVGTFRTTKPDFSAHSIEVLGPGKVERAVPINMATLRLGKHWSRRVQFSGTVESVLVRRHFTLMTLSNEGRRFLVRQYSTDSENQVLEQARRLLGNNRNVWSAVLCHEERSNLASDSCDARRTDRSSTSHIRDQNVAENGLGIRR